MAEKAITFTHSEKPCCLSKTRLLQHKSKCDQRGWQVVQFRGRKCWLEADLCLKIDQNSPEVCRKILLRTESKIPPILRRSPERRSQVR